MKRVATPEPCNGECGGLAQVSTPAGPLCRACAAEMHRRVGQ